MSDVHVSWDSSFIITSYAVSFIGSYCSLLLLEQQRTCNNIRKRFRIVMAASVVFGFVAVWSMHFTAMSAMRIEERTTELQDSQDGRRQLTNVPVLLWPTLGSLLIAVFMTYAGVRIALLDKFFTQTKSTRVITLKEELQHRFTTGDIRRGGARLVQLWAAFSSPKYLIYAGILTGGGASAMHFLGMSAMERNLHIVYSVPLVGVACLIAVVAATAAFWIFFRLLSWKPYIEWLRVGSAAIMAAAVSGMHWTGMSSATYTLRDNPRDGLWVGSKDAAFLGALPAFAAVFASVSWTFAELHTAAAIRHAPDGQPTGTVGQARGDHRKVMCVSTLPTSANATPNPDSDGRQNTLAAPGGCTPGADKCSGASTAANTTTSAGESVGVPDSVAESSPTTTAV